MYVFVRGLVCASVCLYVYVVDVCVYVDLCARAKEGNYVRACSCVPE